MWFFIVYKISDNEITAENVDEEAVVENTTEEEKDNSAVNETTSELVAINLVETTYNTTIESKTDIEPTENEEITTLDGIKRVLKTSDIVITDGVKPVCIAGVMGGENTEVDENTKNILIESAIFDAVSIRYTASKLDLRSEASIRYGKGLSFEYTDAAIERACYLLSKYANATVLTGTLKHDTVDKKEKIVTFKAQEVSSLLGLELTDKDVENELNRLDFPYILNNDTFTVTIPRRRLDIDDNVNDIAEEIGRLYGYQNLVSTLPKLTTRRGVYVGDVKIRKEISKRLRSLGINETKTYTLTSEEMAKTFNYENKVQVKLPNPMTIDKSVIRTSLLPSLINVYEYNKARNIKDIQLYEIAKTYDVNYNEEVKIDYIKFNEIASEFVKTYGLKNTASLKFGVIIPQYWGYAATVSPFHVRSSISCSVPYLPLYKSIVAISLRGII